MRITVAVTAVRAPDNWPSRFDLLLAGGIAAIGQLEAWAPQLMLEHLVGPTLVNAVGYFLTSVVLVWRRRAPVFVLAFITTVSSAQYLLVGASEGLGSFLPMLVSLYAVGRYTPTSSLLVAGPLAMLGVAIHELRDPAFELDGPTVTFWLILVAGWLIGHAFRARQARIDELARHATRLEAEREEQTRRAADQERARIARELHDVVGHAMSVVVLQAGAAQGLLEKGQPTVARQHVGAIEESARQALADMRRLVGLLDRADDGDLTPGPSVTRLQPLLDQLRGAGLPVELSVEGIARPLSPGLDLVAYRIVQEALTNTLRHAGSATAHATLHYGEHHLLVEVTDTGRGSSVQHVGGRGLIGMRERVALYGGDLHAGPGPHGGFQVRARLPLDGSEE